ncbi:uncharacterized protein G2W53_025255 [Senna tora]|uniref:Uncharacterized protein n=1 Tax=Senna tora TaxID=362788 RepID=A0A834WDZ2_9FABA|nr:uncharacterized protein G2W53_025255 [Senna tora]
MVLKSNGYQGKDTDASMNSHPPMDIFILDRSIKEAERSHRSIFTKLNFKS